ncbi:MAG: 50S ribosomal protein L4 [Chlamydiia bacterium]|nr:50S ribosomal protein L4 [Chlamydiia bacterium]
MVAAKKYNLQGQELGTVDVNDKLVEAQVNNQLVKDYMTAYRANQRQWSACTKTRAEVKHTTKKPHPQKGTGGARHGNLVGPQFRGGGIVFGPKPKFNQQVKMNRKEKQAVIRHVIGEKLRQEQLRVIDSMEMDKPQTKTISHFMQTCGLPSKVLFVGHQEKNAHQHFRLSVRNIPGTAFSLAKQVNAYELLLAKEIVMTEEALKEIEQWLCG